MASRNGAGSLNRRVDFQEPVRADDGHGGTILSWETKFSEPARMVPKTGGEEIVASRLQGKQPYILTVRSSTRTRAVLTSWRIRNSRSGAVYAIKSAANLDERDAYIDFLIVEGEDS
jgi:SPP1 family predicted phage head-tail adaptor